MNNFQNNDPRVQTYLTREKIGFDFDKKNWKDSDITLTDNSLTIQGHPVMERWEEGYMSELAGIAATNGGTVLEVGFGMGISANKIQQYNIEKHIIIEPNNKVLEKAKLFTESARTNVELLHGFWEDVVKNIDDNSVSGILFDTYPLNSSEVHKNHYSFFPEAYRILKKNGILTYYSDEIKDFSNEHIEKLMEANFQKIDKRIVSVNPPKDCLYWSFNTIMAPIIIK